MKAWQNFVDGFKPAEVNDSAVNHSPVEYDEKGEKDSETGGIPVQTSGNAETSGLQRSLTGRHVQFIALGGSIGTGLFIGSGGALQSGGPGFLMIDFILIGCMLLVVVMSLGELGTIFPIAGSFCSYSSRFIDPSVGFSMGYNYVLQWLIVLPLELVAASIVIEFWDPNERIPRGVWPAVFLILITIINLFGVRGYGEFEFVGASIKIIAIVGFVIVGIVINVGGAPNGGFYGAKTWHDPGAFNNGFKGFASVFVTAAFSYSGTELIGLAAAETADPRKEIPKAAKQIFVRITLFYLVSLFVVSLLVPYTHPNLTSGGFDVRTSPFVIAINMGGIKVLPSIMNAVILISVVSVGNSSVYASSRTLASMAQIGHAPKIFGYVDRNGRPIASVALCLVLGFLSFLIYASENARNVVFNWLLAISGLSTIITWMCICISHVRFRLAWKNAGHTLEELPWKSPFGLYGSVFGAAFNLLVIIFTFYTSAFPIGEAGLSATERVTTFFQGFISVFIATLFWLGYKFYYGTKLIPISEIDLTTGRKDPVPIEVLRRERQEAAQRPLYKNIIGLVF